MKLTQLEKRHIFEEVEDLDKQIKRLKNEIVLRQEHLNKLENNRNFYLELVKKDKTE
jgi:hypothetical protein